MALAYLDGLGKAALTQADQCVPNSQQYEYYQPVRSIKERGQVFTEDLLTERAIPFQVTEENGYGFLVNTDQGVQKLPAVITPEKATEVAATATLQPVTDMTTTQEEEPAVVEASLLPEDNTLWYLLLGGMGLYLLFGTSEEKPKANGLSGTRAKKRKLKRKTSSTPTVHI